MSLAGGTLFVALLILLPPAFVRADAIITFNVSGFAANASGGTLDSCAAGVSCAFSGMFQVDTTTATVESSGLDITLPGLPTFNALSGSFPSVLFSIPVWTIIASGPTDTMSLIFITEPTPSSLVGFTGGGIFSTTQDTLANYTIDNFSITPAPEPSSLVLFASGLLVLGLAWRFGKKAGHPLSP